MKQIESLYDKKTGELSWKCPKCNEKYIVPSENSFHRYDLLDLAIEAKTRCIRCGTEYAVHVDWNVLFYHMHHHPIKRLSKEDMRRMCEEMERIKREGGV